MMHVSVTVVHCGGEGLVHVSPLPLKVGVRLWVSVKLVLFLLQTLYK